MRTEEKLLEYICEQITYIQSAFKKGAKVTVLVINPGPDANVLVTLDTIPDLIAALEELKERPEIAHPLAQKRS